MYVTPTPETIAAGLRVADPAYLDAAAESLRYLPPEGRDVGDAALDYWIRRQRDGDVVITAGPPAAASSSSSASSSDQAAAPSA